MAKGGKGKKASGDSLIGGHKALSGATAGLPGLPKMKKPKKAKKPKKGM